MVINSTINKIITKRPRSKTKDSNEIYLYLIKCNVGIISLTRIVNTFNPKQFELQNIYYVESTQVET